MLFPFAGGRSASRPVPAGRRLVDEPRWAQADPLDRCELQAGFHPAHVRIGRAEQPVEDRHHDTPLQQRLVVARTGRRGRDRCQGGDVVQGHPGDDVRDPARVDLRGRAGRARRRLPRRPTSAPSTQRAMLSASRTSPRSRGHPVVQRFVGMARHGDHVVAAAGPPARPRSRPVPSCRSDDRLSACSLSDDCHYS